MITHRGKPEHDQTAARLILLVVSVSLTLLTLEVALRVRHHELFRPSAAPESERGMVYDPRLGWTPRPGRTSRPWISNVDASGLRSNGRSIAATGRPILAVGDSFTFGDEVEDGQTWAAQVERILAKRVLNAGVSAYGIDQAVLRAELLLDEYQPDIVILSFISDDIARTELSSYPYGRGLKPYFEFVNGSLKLRNVPVPQALVHGRFETLRATLNAHSYLADSVFSRIAPRWWSGAAPLQRAHHDGENVSANLFARLDHIQKSRSGQFLAVALATNGRIGDNHRLPAFVKLVREQGIRILDLSTETLKLPPDRLRSLFAPRGHYSPAMNGWVAEQIAAFLEDQGLAIRPHKRN